MNTANTLTCATSGKIIDLDIKMLAFYVCSLLFVAGNLLLPQLCHSVALGGQTWLPIYFFTLVGAWCFGWKLGMATALLSPALNYLFFGMPTAGMLTVILIKSSLLALGASWIASRSKGSLGLVIGLMLSIIFYQGLGMLPEILLNGLNAALTTLTLGWPGMLSQLIGGFVLIKAVQFFADKFYGEQIH